MLQLVNNFTAYLVSSCPRWMQYAVITPLLCVQLFSGYELIRYGLKLIKGDF